MAKSSFLPRRNKGYFGQKVTKTLFGNSPIMENTITYKERQGVHVPKDVKVYILKRVKEGGKTVKEIAAEHGIGATAIYHWLKNETGGASDTLVTKLQKENQILKQPVAELSLKIREGEKNGQQIKSFGILAHSPSLVLLPINFGRKRQKVEDRY